MDELKLLGNVAGSISGLLGKQTAIGKGFAVAEAIMNTYAGATLALADKTQPSTALRIISAAAVILQGLGYVSQILSVKTPGGSGASQAPIINSPSAKSAYATPTGGNTLTQPSINSMQNNVFSAQGMLTAKDIAAEIAKLPTPVVTVEDINVRSKAVKRVEVRANI
jgi:hypothetical protein